MPDLYFIVNLNSFYNVNDFFKSRSYNFNYLEYNHFKIGNFKNLKLVIDKHDFVNNPVDKEVNEDELLIKIWNKLSIDFNKKHGSSKQFIFTQSMLKGFTDLKSLTTFKNSFENFKFKILICYPNIFTIIYSFFLTHPKNKDNIEIFLYKHFSEISEYIGEVFTNFELVFDDIEYVDCDLLEYKDINFYKFMLTKFNLRNKPINHFYNYKKYKFNYLKDFSQNQLAKIEELSKKMPSFTKYLFLKDRNLITNCYEYYIND